MVRPGVTTRKPRENLVLPGWRTALMVCHAMIIAMTVDLARTRGQLECQTHQFRVGVVVGVGEVFEEPFSNVAAFWGTTSGQPDRRSPRLRPWQKEWPNAAELVVPPVLDEALSFRFDQPVVRTLQFSPLIDTAPEFVDDRSWIVLLRLSGKPLALVENNRLLVGLCFDLSRLRNRGDEFRPAAVRRDPLGRLTVTIEFPVGGRVRIGRVGENRPLEELIIQIEPVPAHAPERAASASPNNRVT